jgi:hypothetical protein
MFSNPFGYSREPVNPYKSDVLLARGQKTLPQAKRSSSPREGTLLQPQTILSVLSPNSYPPYFEKYVIPFPFPPNICPKNPVIYDPSTSKLASKVLLLRLTT